MTNDKTTVEKIVSDTGIESNGIWLDVDNVHTLFVDAGAVEAHVKPYRDALKALVDACASDVLWGHGYGDIEHPTDDDVDRAIELVDFNGDLRAALQAAVGILKGSATS